MDGHYCDCGQDHGNVTKKSRVMEGVDEAISMGSNLPYVGPIVASWAVFFDPPRQLWKMIPSMMPLILMRPIESGKQQRRSIRGDKQQ